MEERIYDETEEILENNAGNIPEDLKRFLDADEKTLSEIENVLSTIDDKKNALETEKEDTENEFERRLKEFTENLEKEKADAFDILAKKEQDLDAEKARIEDIKLKEQGNQVNFIDSLKEVSDTYDSKINSISEAIKACEDNDTLTKALEEEKDKKEKLLKEKYDDRKNSLDKVLEEIGVKNTKPSIDPDTEINLDFRTPEEIEKESLNSKLYEEPLPNLLNTKIDEYEENEIVDREKREDIINEIYQSEEIMEGQVFPYLRSVSE